MSRNDDLWLAERLGEEPMPDEGFSARVLNRIERDERRRRSVLLSVSAAAGSVVLAFLIPSDPSWVYRLTGDSWQLIALLLGLGLSGAFWIDTEPVRPLR